MNAEVSADRILPQIRPRKPHFQLPPTLQFRPEFPGKWLPGAVQDSFRSHQDRLHVEGDADPFFAVAGLDPVG